MDPFKNELTDNYNSFVVAGNRTGNFGVSVMVRFVIAIMLLITFVATSSAQSGGRTYTGPTKPVEPAKPTGVVSPVKPPIKPKSSPDRTSDHKSNETKSVKVILPTLVRVPGGVLVMGSRHRPNEMPIHNVEIEGFEIGAYEISNQEFDAFVSATNYQTQAELAGNQVTWRSYFPAGRENFPVVCVSWLDADAFCKWLSENTGEKFRLPTEAEWEYAARGGLVSKDYPWGDEIDDNLANFDSDGSNSMVAGVSLELLQPLNSYNANGYGLYNVAGNVWEWCQDWYDEHYYQNSPANNPIGPDKGIFKVMRGGGWVNDGSSCRVGYRNFNSTNYNMPYLGFRIVKAAH